MIIKTHIGKLAVQLYDAINAKVNGRYSDLTETEKQTIDILNVLISEEKDK